MMELTLKEKDEISELEKYLNYFQRITKVSMTGVETSFTSDFPEGSFVPLFYLLLPLDLKEEVDRFKTMPQSEERLEFLKRLIKKIKKWYSLTVFVIGCGGVGGYFCWFSAKAELPIYRYVLIDDDIVEQKNVKRQIFRSCDVGKPKVLALKEIIEESNDFPEVFPVVSKATDKILEQIREVLEKNPFTFVLVATDTAKSKAEIYQKLNSKRVFLISNDRDKIEIKNELSDEDVKVWGEDNGYRTGQNFLANLLSGMLAIFEGSYYYDMGYSSRENLIRIFDVKFKSEIVGNLWNNFKSKNGGDKDGE